MIAILDETKGIEMFDAVFGTVLRSTSVLVQAAQFILPGDASEEDAKKFLQKRIPKRRNANGNKVFAHILKGQGRGIDVVRTAFVSLPSSSPFLLRTKLIYNIARPTMVGSLLWTLRYTSGLVGILTVIFIYMSFPNHVSVSVTYADICKL